MYTATHNTKLYTIDEDVEGFYWILNESSPHNEKWLQNGDWLQDGPFTTQQEAEQNVINYITKEKQQ